MITTLCSHENNYGTTELVHEVLVAHFQNLVNTPIELNINEQVYKPAAAMAKSQSKALTRVGEACSMKPNEGFILVYSYRHWTSFASLQSPSHKRDIYWPAEVLAEIQKNGSPEPSQ